MSDSGYSRLEKDFLGIERMVHYDAAGNMTGTSEVFLEADGSRRISNEVHAVSVPTEEAAAFTPPVASKPVVEPNVASAAASGPKPEYREGYSVPTVVSFGLAAFVGAAVIGLVVITAMRSGSNRDSSVQSYTPPIQNQNSTLPEQRYTPPAPPSNNDNPYDSPVDPDQTRPGDPDRPRIDGPAPVIEPSDPALNPNGDQPQGEVKPSTEPEKPKVDPKPSSTDPIDLRGDGEPAPEAPKNNDSDPDIR